jgi:hypothetical protein
MRQRLREISSHDFRGTAIDSQHARIGVQAADFIFAHEAIAAEELQASIDDPAMHRTLSLNCWCSSS